MSHIFIPNSSGGGTPGGALTSVQFNDNGAFGGTGLSYDKTKLAFSNDLSFTDDVPHLISVQDASVTDTSGQSLTLRAGAGLGTGNGADISLQAGDRGALGSGGNVLLVPGLGDNATNEGKVEMQNRISGLAALFDTSLIATSGKTYTFPNKSGTFAMTSDITSGITIGTTTITSGTNTRILYNNSGVVGEYTITGTGTVAVMQNSPTLTTPTLSGKVPSYNGVSTTGWGIPAIYGTGRSTGQTGDVASVATYTCGAADGSFIVSCNANCTAFTAGVMAVQCIYTDETNTARTLVLSTSNITGTIGTSFAATGAFEGLPLHIRVKASTSITIKTVGTAWTGTYNVEGVITQIA